MRKKKRVAPGAKKKERAAALRRLGLLRIDGYLIIERSAIWKFFRMRFTNSAAAAQRVQPISFFLRSGSGKRKQTHAKDAPKRKLRIAKYFADRAALLVESVAFAYTQRL